MSVVETIRGLRKMSVTDGAATPPPSPRIALSVASVVAGLGGLDLLLANGAGLVSQAAGHNLSL